MQRRLAVVAFGLLGSLGLLGAASACTSKGATPPTVPVVGPPAGDGAAPSGSASPSPSIAVVPPLPSNGFYGPGAFVVSWSETKFISAQCPAAHPTATCYAGKANAILPVIGRVALNRTVAVGDGSAIAPSGCVSAVTDGTITSPTGSLTFHALGLLCGRTSAYTVTRSTGAGTMAGRVLEAQIINDSDGETWSGEITGEP